MTRARVRVINDDTGTISSSKSMGVRVGRLRANAGGLCQQNRTADHRWLGIVMSMISPISIDYNIC